MTTQEKRPTKAQRRKSQLEWHYKRCLSLGQSLGSKYEGKTISNKLRELEKFAHDAATAHCNGEIFRGYDFCNDENAWDKLSETVKGLLKGILGGVPHGFFVNGDARGYALKIDSDHKLNLDLHQDWGGYQILSPEIDGD